MNGQQLELTFDETAAFEPLVHRRISRERAAWWFERIQTRLQRAFQKPLPARPEQVRLELGSGAQRWQSRPVGDRPFELAAPSQEFEQAM